ncbi:MAG: hypothetical protein ACQET1_07010 [Gemmatimonadota bacterium]
MGLFEFLMILVSVVIGLGLTETLSGLGRLLRSRETVRFHWLHALFQFGVFFALLQQWWESWEWVGLEEISFLAVLALLAQPVVLYLIAYLLYPASAENTDLEAYYYRHAPLLWGLVLAGTLVGNVIRPLVWGSPVLDLSNLSGVPTAAICLVLAVTRVRRAHSILAPLLILILLADTLLSGLEISAR